MKFYLEMEDMKANEKYVTELDKRKIRIRLAELDMNVSDWARKAGINPRVLHTMLKLGRPRSPNWEAAATALGWKLEDLSKVQTGMPDHAQKDKAA
jgi:predicted transcriptional regulator